MGRLWNGAITFGDDLLDDGFPPKYARMSFWEKIEKEEEEGGGKGGVPFRELKRRAADDAREKK